MSFNSTGKQWTLQQFESYLQTISPPSWIKSITLHHTASPNLLQRPNGFLPVHINNLKFYYEKQMKWKSGPHLFVCDHHISGMTPLTEKGVHAVSFNSSSIGIEVLGDYDSEDPKSGRGLKSWQNTAQTVRILSKWLNLPITDKTILFHRDDIKTNKTCPGKKVTKEWIIDLINFKPNPPKKPICSVCDGEGKCIYCSQTSKIVSRPPVSSQTDLPRPPILPTSQNGSKSILSFFKSIWPF